MKIPWDVSEFGREKDRVAIGRKGFIKSPWDA